MISRPLNRFVRLLAELRRRKVYQVALAYVVVGFMVIEAADLTLVRLGLPPWTVTFVVVLVGLGFPIALVLAWALEVTPEGVRVDTAEEASEEERQLQASATPSLWIGASVLALLLVGTWWMWGGLSAENSSTDPTGGTLEVEERSIAVLPFEPLSSGEESETFARGVHDDLLTRLSNVGDLTVISRTAAERYRDTDLTTGQIADSLGVRWILEGGVQVLGEQIQVNAQLIDPRSEAHAWAETYQRALTAEDLFAIQGEITGEIADALQAQLTAGEQSRVTGAPTRDLEAYRLYVQGRQAMLSWQPDSLRRAIGFFERALEHDSTYALAWSGLADARALYSSFRRGGDFESIREALPEAEAAARRALKLGPELAEAHASWGLIFHFKQAALEDQSNGPAALHHLRRAVQLKPSYAPAQERLGYLLLHLGRPEQGLKHLRLAIELSPDNVSARWSLTRGLLATRNFEEALRVARPLRNLPPDGDELRWEAKALVHLKRWEDVRARAREARSKTDDLPEWTTLDLALADVATGEEASARGWIQKLRVPEGRHLTPIIHAALGELDRAFTGFREGLSEPKSRWQLILPLRYHYPDLLRAFRADPRYEKLIREINEYWGLNPDGTLPDSADVSLPSSPQADA